MSVLRALGRLVVAAVVLLLGRGRRPRALEPPTRIVEPQPPRPRPELVVVLLLALAAAAAVFFIVVYAVEWFGANTQLLGLALGLAFAFLAAAAIVTGKRLVPEEELSEPYPEPFHEPEESEVAQIVEESRDTFTRRRLLFVAAGGTGAALGAALLVPLASLGPALDTDRLYRSPWSRGTRLVDSDGRPLVAHDVQLQTIFTAFPEDADPDELGSPLVVVRLPLDDLRLPSDRHRWAPGGIVAYSKICTHAGCAVSLYRAPTYEPTSPGPALVCPCHYSTFDPATGGRVMFGPAGRDLPQLPLEIDGDGHLRAAGDFSGPIGPSWWGVRERL
jgi:ubiquinol-cytochrome c reductase iron-sulfur subunit